MAYYLRVFCASDAPVTIWEVVEAAAAEGVELRPENGTAPDDPSWSAVTLGYAPRRPPLVVELERDPEAINEEVDEFVEAVTDAEPSDARERVLARLKTTRMVAAIDFPSTDADDATYDAAGSVLRFFAERCEGLIQADGEGFYEGPDLILEID